MCDYSLHNVASRSAKVGDDLITTTFAGCSTRGFAAVEEPNVAVCLLPGTEVAFQKEVEHERRIGFLPSVRLTSKLARFRQVNKDQLDTYHDALEFADGTVVLVTRLSVGQRATVLQLPIASHSTEDLQETTAGMHERKRSSTVA
jgi:hypothetical protein